MNQETVFRSKGGIELSIAESWKDQLLHQIIKPRPIEVVVILETRQSLNVCPRQTDIVASFGSPLAFTMFISSWYHEWTQYFSMDGNQSNSSCPVFTIRSNHRINPSISRQNSVSAFNVIRSIKPAIQVSNLNLKPILKTLIWSPRVGALSSKTLHRIYNVGASIWRSD